MPFAIKPKQTVLFIGDSITDCGRRDSAAPLGNGYVRIASELITAKYPAHQLNIINKGISGNTVRDLHGRWGDDAMAFKPDWISIKIGINDLHRTMANVADQAVTPEQFADLYDKILTRVKKETKANIVLVDPFYISNEDGVDNHRGRVLAQLPKYIDVVSAMAKKYKARQVKTQVAFKNLLKYKAADALCPEPVHPYASGHTVIALEWLKTVGW